MSDKMREAFEKLHQESVRGLEWNGEIYTDSTEFSGACARAIVVTKMYYAFKVGYKAALSEVVAESSQSEPVAQKLLMMFIRDCYTSSSGKISKNTALATMRYVSGDSELQRLVNISDWAGVTDHTHPSQVRRLSDEDLRHEAASQYLESGAKMAFVDGARHAENAIMDAMVVKE